MSKRNQEPTGRSLSNDNALTLVEHGASDEEQGARFKQPDQLKKGGWFHYTNLKVEGAIFLLIALTFAAVLGQKAVTSRHLDITSRISQYFPFVFGDQDDGGKSSIEHDNSKPLNWSCTLREGAKFAYCGYGIQFEAPGTGRGIDFSKYQNITLKLNYRGTGDHLRILLQNIPPSSLGGRVKPTETVPFVAEFPVVQGQNEVHLNRDQFAIERWWLNSHNLAPEEVASNMDGIVSLAFSSGSQTPRGRLDVSVSAIDFHGVSISTDQWYLIILGIWLVLTGGFLVFRFLGMRRVYEDRQRRQSEENRAIADARAAAEAASLAKSQFLANMSHELRTPLNAILGYAQLLKRAQPTERDLAAIQTIEHSGEHLLTMITDILDIAKVEAGRLELLPDTFDIRSCVLNIAQMVRLRAEEKGLLFTVAIADDLPQKVVADQKRIRQVLINLLGNAIKFTPTGDIRLEVSLIAHDAGQIRLRFAIIDTGVGIEPEQLDRIFRPFEQAGNAIDRSGGTGLGLSITHNVVRMMDGEIHVESKSGQGSRFVVEVPFGSAADSLETLEFKPEANLEELKCVSDTVDVTEDVMVAPGGKQMERLLFLARSGNLSAIRKEVPEIIASGQQYQRFAEHLDRLAAAYQSPAVLRFIETYANERNAA